MTISHQTISFIKSAVRIAGYFLGAWAATSEVLWTAFLVLIVSEIIGIAEEIGHP